MSSIANNTLFATPPTAAQAAQPPPVNIIFGHCKIDNFAVPGIKRIKADEQNERLP